LFPEGCDLAGFEIGEDDPAPAFGGADHGAEHELQDRFFSVQFPWRWDGGTISANLDVIWEMSD
jgi:hypothetical protein